MSIAYLSKKELETICQLSKQSVEQLKEAGTIGCFSCVSLVDFEAIDQLIHENGKQRGVCPNCSVDALIPLDPFKPSAYETILQQLHDEYFEKGISFGDWLAEMTRLRE